MFGTIAKIRIKAGAEGQFEKLSQDFERDRGPSEGWIATAVYKSDEDPQELWMAVVFKDRESYEANADSPEQAQMYDQMRDLMESDPEWHDGEVIHRATA